MSSPETHPQQTSPESAPNLCKYSTDQLKTIQKSVFPDGKPDEVRLFGIVCTRTGLDPFTKQIYAIKNRGRVQFMTGIDGLRAIASRSPRYLGQDGPYWCGADGEWKDVWLEKTPPAAAKVIVLVTGPDGSVLRVPAVAHWAEYGSNKNVWGEKPSLMIAKCAESLGLRKAFPNDISGLYTQEEMASASPMPQEPIPAETPTAKNPQPEIDAIVDQALSLPGPEPEPETEQAPEAEQEPPDQRITPTKADFLDLLKEKGVETEAAAMLLIKTTAENRFGTADMRSLSDDQKAALFQQIASKTADDLFPEN